MANKADDIQFSFEEFSSHVREFVKASAEFQSALNVSKDDLNNFISAALQLNQNGGDT